MRRKKYDLPKTRLRDIPYTGEIEHIPFKHLNVCPECGRKGLKIVWDEKYRTNKGLDRLVVYRCPDGHEARSRQQVVKAPAVSKEVWERLQ